MESEDKPVDDNIDAEESEEETSSLPGNDSNEPVKISKNQLKKRRREEYMRNKKLEKKQAEKQRRLEKRLAPPTTDGSGNDGDEHRPHQRSCRNKEVREHYLSSYEKSFAVIIDCNWESLHKENALKSLANQMSYCYGANRRHSHPCKMYVTGLGPRLGEKLSKMNIENWKAVTVYKEEYTEISEFSKTKCDPASISSESENAPSKVPKQLVYLTADSDNLIETLDPDCAYIIGGIVDRNSAKGQTLAKAVAEGVVTARLPIKESIAISSSQVLTVNHVFEILLNFAQCQNWTEAIDKVLPKRKVAAVVAGDEQKAVEDTSAAVEAENGETAGEICKEEQDSEKETV